MLNRTVNKLSKFWTKKWVEGNDDAREAYNKSSHNQVQNYTANPVNISTLVQRCFNVVDQRWNNVDRTLKIKQNLTSNFQRCTTLMQRRYPTLKQRWYSFISMLFQHGLNVSKSYIKFNRAKDKYGLVNRWLSFILLNSPYNILTIQLLRS